MEQIDLVQNSEGPPPKLLTGDDLSIEGSKISWAIFSKDRLYRYLLGRLWHEDYPWFVCGMLNPSKADATEDDGFDKKLRHYCRAFGADCLSQADFSGPL